MKKKNKEIIYTFKKFKLGNVILRNRIISSPISINMANKFGFVSKNIINFFSNLGNSGVGIVTIGAASISQQGSDTKNGMVVGPNKFQKGLKLLSRSVKKTGSRVSLQVYHVGSQGNPKHNGQEIVGPSTYFFPVIGIKTRALKLDEIYKIEKQFISALVSGYKCGFDFVELHLAHGYLLHEFLSNFFNKRKDIYGGSFHNRLRIVLNIIQGAYEKCPKLQGRLGFRISANDYLQGGFNIRTAKNLIKILDLYKPAYYVVTAGQYETANKKYIDMKKGNYWKYAKMLKKFTKTPIIAQGGITNLYSGDNLIKEKYCDLFGMAQSLIADPKLIDKTLKKKEKKIIPCMAHIKVGSCHRCRYLKQKDLTFSCITPTSWTPPESYLSKNKRKKDLKIWDDLNKEVY